MKDSLAAGGQAGMVLEQKPDPQTGRRKSGGCYGLLKGPVSFPQKGTPPTRLLNQSQNSSAATWGPSIQTFATMGPFSLKTPHLQEKMW